MQYAKWKLSFTNNKGTGPEQVIAKAGAKAEGAFELSDISAGGFVLGYLLGELPQIDLSAWEFQIVDANTALSLVQALDTTAYFTDDGRIARIVI